MKYTCIKDKKHYKLSIIKETKGLSVKKESSAFQVKVSKMKVFSAKYINLILKKKTKHKLEMYLNYLITYIEEGGEDGTTDLRHALNDLTRYKGILKAKYNKYLEEKYVDLLLKKIAVLEEELKTRIIEYELKEMKENTHDYQEKVGKSR